MTPAEFKERFKVGDVIRNKIEKHIAPFLTITFIGKSSFVCIDDYDIERLFTQGHDWEKVEQEKKPSEEINEKVLEELNYAPGLRNFRAELITESKCKHILQWLDENWPKVAKK